MNMLTEACFAPLGQGSCSGSAQQALPSAAGGTSPEITLEGTGWAGANLCLPDDKHTQLYGSPYPKLHLTPDPQTCTAGGTRGHPGKGAGVVPGERPAFSSSPGPCSSILMTMGIVFYRLLARGFW